MARYAYSREDQGDLNTSTVKSARNKEHVDIDLNFTPKATSGDIFKKTQLSAVKQSIKNLLMTNRLEKPFVANFGANITGMLFELADGESDYFLKKDIVSTIQIFEPRVQVLNLDVKVDPDYNRLGVKLEFKIRNTNEVAEFSTTLRRLR
jgi:phage baseplate assembly protein W